MKFESYIQKLLDRKVFPGITILAGSHEGDVFRNCYGNSSIEPQVEKLKCNHIYDLASLTKPLITSLLILILIENGELSEDSHVSEFLPGFYKETKIIHLLTHTSGIPAWYPLYLREKNHIKVISELNRNSKPGRKVIYSCLGYILLAEIVKKITGKNFVDVAEDEIIKKVGLKNSFFKIPTSKLSECVPTEKGNRYEASVAERDYPLLSGKYDWRKNILRGEVNDGNAFFLRGDSGNAGFFSTADDLFVLSREFYPEFTTILKPDAAKKFWRNFTPFKRAHRSLGFKLNSSIITSGGRSLSRKAIGHSGFTGTSIWMEPDSFNVFILLTNRIHPYYDPKINFNYIRRKLHKLIKKDLGMN